MPDSLTPADPKALTQAILYALRFSLTGRPHGKKIREDAEWMADHIVQHLARANFVISRGPPAKAHTAGGDGPGRTDKREG